MCGFQPYNWLFIRTTWGEHSRFLWVFFFLLCFVFFFGEGGAVRIVQSYIKCTALSYTCRWYRYNVTLRSKFYLEKNERNHVYFTQFHKNGPSGLIKQIVLTASRMLLHAFPSMFVSLVHATSWISGKHC